MDVYPNIYQHIFKYGSSKIIYIYIGMGYKYWEWYWIWTTTFSYSTMICVDAYPISFRNPIQKSHDFPKGPPWWVVHVSTAWTGPSGSASPSNWPPAKHAAPWCHSGSWKRWVFPKPVDVENVEHEQIAMYVPRNILRISEKCVCTLAIEIHKYIYSYVYMYIYIYHILYEKWIIIYIYIHCVEGFEVCHVIPPRKISQVLQG